MEKRIWIKFNTMQLFPNTYILLVGPPGIGKSVVLSQVEGLWRSVEDFHVAPSSVTKASLVDTLNDAKRKIVRPTEVPPYVEFNSLLVLASEFGVFLPSYETDFMTTLTKVYDCEAYDERRRTRDLNIKIPNPQLNIIGGTTPNYLTTLFPEGAWEQGFASRTLIVFSGEQIVVDPFGEGQRNETTFKDLSHDLKIISRLYGKMSWTPEAVATMQRWHFGGGEPRPNHPKLINYLTRRTTHLAKLCMVASISESNDRIITEDHFREALDWLVEAEFFMPDLFKSMTIGGDSVAIEETWHFIWTVSEGGKKSVAEHRIVRYLTERVANHSVARILDLMIRARMIKLAPGDNSQNFYLPVPKTAQG